MKGFSLLETTLSCALLGLVLIALFSCFELGSRAMRLGSTRQGLQTQARRVAEWIEPDVRRSAFSMCSWLSRSVTASDGSAVSRDALAVSALLHPHEAASYDSAYGQPRWDSFATLWASTEPGEAHLYRQSVTFAAGSPALPLLAPLALDASAGGNLSDAPADPARANRLPPGARLGSTRVLADAVRSFSVRVDPQHEALQVNLRLRQKGGARPGTSAQPLDESLELSFELAPECGL